jgi:hypothetical protein
LYPSYYALRRVNPYRGVVQHVDVGEATAASHDGLTWHLRADDGHGWVRPVGVWEEGVGFKVGHRQGLDDLLAALETRPALPFPVFDTQELWLLDRDSGQPLALLATDRGTAPGDTPADAEWFPFVLSYTGFHSPALDRRDAVTRHAGDAHRDFLARVVNRAARPHPMTQWFRRGQDGIGKGESGRRLPHEWRGRELPAAAFPELLVREDWNNQLEQSVISDYHRWLAPLLLLWPRLSMETRRRLEIQACEKPRWLARIHRLLPARVDPARIQAALVAARLEEAQADAAQDAFM